MSLITKRTDPVEWIHSVPRSLRKALLSLSDGSPKYKRTQECERRLRQMERNKPCTK